jgi:ribosomal protein L11 methyltransferase
MLKYIQLEIVIPEDVQELLIAELADLDFEGFDQYPNHMIAWIPAKHLSDVSREEVERILSKFGKDCFIRSEQIQEPKNWNEEWEATIQPMQIGKFYVTPTWATVTPPEELLPLYIDPKMAFGTGYHETTRIVLRLLPDIIKKDDVVLDAGTGTGILAIAAVKLGAKEVLGFDIDEWSFENATENIYLNKTETAVTIKLGDEKQIPDNAQYDVVIANINKNILVDMAHHLNAAIRTGGKLILSGLLVQDEDDIKTTSGFSELTHLKTERENDWIGMTFLK